MGLNRRTSLTDLIRQVEAHPDYAGGVILGRADLAELLTGDPRAVDEVTDEVLATSRDLVWRFMLHMPRMLELREALQSAIGRTAPA